MTTKFENATLDQILVDHDPHHARRRQHPPLWLMVLFIILAIALSASLVLITSVFQQTTHLRSQLDTATSQSKDLTSQLNDAKAQLKTEQDKTSAAVESAEGYLQVAQCELGVMNKYHDTVQQLLDGNTLAASTSLTDAKTAMDQCNQIPLAATVDEN